MACGCERGWEKEDILFYGELTDAVREHVAIADALGTIIETEIEEKEKKNLLKFLTSDDSASVHMGVTMLKGILKE